MSSIAIFTRLAEQELHTNGAGAAVLLRRIGSNSQVIMEALDDIVWMIRPGNNSLDIIMARLNEYASAM